MARHVGKEIAKLKQRFELPQFSIVGHQLSGSGEEFERAEREALRLRAKKLVRLEDLVAPVIIVPASTEIVYYNQVAGHSCMQRYLEGYLVPVVPLDQADPRVSRTPDIFNPLLQEGVPWGRFSAQHFPEIERQLNHSLQTTLQHVSCIENADNDEAWIWVRFQLMEVITEETNENDDLLGVLTWSNSD